MKQDDIIGRSPIFKVGAFEVEEEPMPDDWRGASIIACVTDEERAARRIEQEEAKSAVEQRRQDRARLEKKRIEAQKLLNQGLSRKQAALKIGVNDQTVYNWVQKGRLTMPKGTKQ